MSGPGDRRRGPVTHKSRGKVRRLPSGRNIEQVTGEQFAKILHLRRLFSYVVVDTSSGLTDAVLSAMTPAM
jgi:MinD-like ATPase involved in chromosome partitioning or flagellar assembly